MIESSLWRTDSLWLETAVVLGIFAVGNILFGHSNWHWWPARDQRGTDSEKAVAK
jgi:uncharacterized membrane protein YphA (DoxX/SURF4 family)